MKDRIIPALMLGFFGLVAVVIVALGYNWTHIQKPRLDPVQPIKFPHYIHAGNLSLDCKFCHKYVDKSTFASIPNIQVCMTCHQTAATDRPEIKKLTRFWKEHKQVPWKVIHKLPDFVYFSHKRHIKAGLDCANCHGPIQVVKQVRQVKSLTMGFCVRCHKIKKASLDCATCHK